MCQVDGEKDYWEAGDAVRSLREQVPLRTTEEGDLLAEFYQMFNEWLKKVRAPARD
jgi:hypothetical protein